MASSLGLRARVLLAAAVLAASLGVGVQTTRASQNFIDVDPAYYFWEVYPYTCTGYGVESLYLYTEAPDVKYSTAEHTDTWSCLTQLASKAWIGPTYCYPYCFYESSWDIGADYSNATKWYWHGYYAYGQFQGNIYNTWTSYFLYSAVLPN